MSSGARAGASVLALPRSSDRDILLAFLFGLAIAICWRGPTAESLSDLSADFLKAQKVSPWRDLPVWIPGQGDHAGFHRRDIRRALGAGLVFRPLPQTSADTLAWFKTLPQDRQATLKAGLSAEREAVLLANWAAVADK